MNQLFLDFSFSYLLERQNYRGWEGERTMFHLLIYSPVDEGWAWQETGIPAWSPVRVAGAQALEPSSAASQESLGRSWIRNSVGGDHPNGS